MKKRFSLAFWHRPRAGRRAAALAVSTILMGFGVAVFDCVGLGVDPCSTFSMGLSGRTGYSFGTCQFAMNLLLFLPVILLEPSLIGIGTLANMVVVGFSADFFLMLLRPLVSPASPLLLRLLLLAAALCVFLPAVAFYIVVDLGVAPYDAGSQIIAARVKRLSYRTIRVAWDITFLLMGWLLGATVGLTTLVTGFMVGPVVAAVRKRVEPLFE